MAFDRAEWVALGGKSRNYRNSFTGETLSRRQFDKLAGRIPVSYERKAKANATPEQVLKPARGRTAYHGDASSRGLEIARRMDVSRETKKEKAITEKYKRRVDRRHREWEIIKDSSFGKSSARRIRVDFDVEAIERARVAGARNPHIFGYLVYLDFLNPVDGSDGAFNVLKARDIKKPYTEDDFERMEELAFEKSVTSGMQFLVYGCTVEFLLRMDYVRSKREKAKARQRKKVFGK